PNRRESTVYSRDDTRLGTARTGKPQENGARILLKGRAPSRVGSSASCARTAHGEDDARIHRPRRRALGSTAWKTDGIDTVFRPVRRRVCCPRPAAWVRPRPQGRQAGQYPGESRERRSTAHRVWHRLTPSTRAPVASASRVHRRDARLHGTRTDRTDESLDRFPQRPLLTWRHALPDAHGLTAVHRVRSHGVGPLPYRQKAGAAKRAVEGRPGTCICNHHEAT